MKTLLLGNAGAGKSTLAARLCANQAVPQMSLDSVAFTGGAERRPLAESIALCEQFMAGKSDWIIEGCYADILQALLPHADQLLFLNPGVDTCLAHCRQRPWEPGKFDSPQAQAAHLDFLLDWVTQYPSRSDEYGLAAHRALFDGYSGPKLELTDPADYAAASAPA